jgi:hypothetical protein
MTACKLVANMSALVHARSSSATVPSVTPSPKYGDSFSTIHWPKLWRQKFRDRRRQRRPPTRDHTTRRSADDPAHRSIRSR